MTSTVIKFAVAKSDCKRCDKCIKDCPISVLERGEDGFPQVSSERADACVLCQHCLAICPEAAISIGGLRPENSQVLTPDRLPRFEQMEHLVHTRRSVRQYRTQNVERELIQRLLDAAAHAPTGLNARELTFTVIDDREVLANLRTLVVDGLVAIAATGRFAERAEYIIQAAEAWRNTGRDLVFRNAPHVLIVSAPPGTPTPEQDVPLTLAYFELLAQSAGLGTVWCGFLKLALEALPSLKPLLSLEAGHTYYPMLFGYPAVRYARTVQREGSARVHRVVNLGLQSS